MCIWYRFELFYFLFIFPTHVQYFIIIFVPCQYICVPSLCNFKFSPAYRILVSFSPASSFYPKSFIFRSLDPWILLARNVNIFIYKSAHLSWYLRLSLIFWLPAHKIYRFSAPKDLWIFKAHRSSNPWILNFWILESITFESSYQYRKQKEGEQNNVRLRLCRRHCALSRELNPFE